MDDGLRERLKAAAEWLENRRAETLQDEITFKLMAKDVRHTLNAVADLTAKLAAAEKRAERAEASWRLAYSRLTRALAEPAADDRAALVELATWIEAAGLAPADEPAGPWEVTR
jgi:hypothetical protein